MQDLTSGQNYPEVPINENFETLGHASVYGKRQPVTTGLTWGYYGGRWGGVVIADGTLTLTPSAVNQIVVHRVTGAISIASGSPNEWDDTTTYARVYQLTTDGSSVTAEADYRAGPFGVHGQTNAGTVALSDLTDVDVASSPVATAGDALVYDADGKWRPRAMAGSTIGKHSIPVAASGISPSVTSGCADLAVVSSVASPNDRPNVRSLDFDAGAIEYAEFSISMPKKWNRGTITVAFRWSHDVIASSPTLAGVVWGAQAVAIGNGDSLDSAFGTAQEVTDAGGVADAFYITSETAAITIAGTPQAEDEVFFRIYRKATDGSDTLDIDARLHGVVVYVTTDAETDA